MTSGALRPRTVLAYGAPALPLALFGITFYVFLPKYYADVVGVSLTALGAIILASRVFDAVTDPLIGLASDRTRSRRGRRRPWLVAAVVPLALALAALVEPPADAGAATAWLAAWTFLFFLSWTMLAVPYEALGVEVSFDYDARTRLLGTREGAVVLGTLLAAVAPVAVSGLAALPAGAVGERARLELLAGCYVLVLLAAVAACVTLVGEHGLAESQRPHGNLLRGLATVRDNQPFRVLLAAYTVSAFGAALPATLILFYVEHVLGSDRGELFLVLYLAVGFALLPGWVWLARRWEKKQAWLAAMAVNSGAFVGVLFLGAGDEAAFTVLVTVSALGLGGTLAIPPAMQADVIDVDEWASGERREGQYIGIWSVAKKLAAALGAGLAFPVLDAAGYVAGAVQPASAVLALKLLYAGLPSLCNLVAIALAWPYPVDRELHRQIRAAIDVRRAGAANPS